MPYYQISSPKYTDVRHVMFGREIYIYIRNLKRYSLIVTRSPMVTRWSLSILHSLIQSYVVARSSYDGRSLSYDQSWQIADSHRLSYDGRGSICDFNTIW